MTGMGKGPHQPVIRIAEIGNPIYYKTDKRAASASRATKAGREGGTGSPAPWLRSSAVFNCFRSITQYSTVASMASEIEGRESPSEEGPEHRSYERRATERWSSGVGSRSEGALPALYRA